MKEFIELVKFDTQFSRDMLTIESAMKVADIMIFESYVSGEDYETLTEASIGEIAGKIFDAILRFLKSIRDWFKKMWAKLTGKSKDVDKKVEEFKETFIEGKKGPLLLPAPDDDMPDGEVVYVASDDDVVPAHEPEKKTTAFKGDVIEKLMAAPNPKKIVISTALSGISPRIQGVLYRLESLNDVMSKIEAVESYLAAGPNRWRSHSERGFMRHSSRIALKTGADGNDLNMVIKFEGELGLNRSSAEVEIGKDSELVYKAKTYILSYDRDLKEIDSAQKRADKLLEKVNKTVEKAKKKFKKVSDPNIVTGLKEMSADLQSSSALVCKILLALRRAIVSRAVESVAFLDKYVKAAGVTTKRAMPNLDANTFKKFDFDQGQFN